MTIEELYIQTLNTVYVIFGYDIPGCSSVVIFDNFVVLVSRFYWYFCILTFSGGLLCGAGCPVGG